MPVLIVVFLSVHNLPPPPTHPFFSGLLCLCSVQSCSPVLSLSWSLLTCVFGLAVVVCKILCIPLHSFLPHCNTFQMWRM